MDLTAIILTRDEEVHIARCIESLKATAKRIVVVDSGSTDRTTSIAVALGAEVFRQDWLGYARQFNWALDHCAINTAWVMRLDCDEYLDEKLIESLKGLQRLPETVTGVRIRRSVVFMNRMLQFGGCASIDLLRVWRTGFGRVEDLPMDEHVVLSGGRSVAIEGSIVDHNLNPLGWWIDKHNGYAAREALAHFVAPQMADRFGGQSLNTRAKRFLKINVYGRVPRFLRPWIFFAIRYFLQGGFLDGRPGFVWHFFQGLWYRMLVDAKIYEAELLARQNGGAPLAALLANNPGLAVYGASPK